MPFTGSHACAVLPLVAAKRRLPVDPTCLVVGSMAPDLEYFARGYISGGKLGHDWIGIFLWCLPVTLIVAWLWHRVFKWPLAYTAPRALAARLAPHFARPWPRRNVVVLGTSAIIGAASHLAWDACTHEDGWVVIRSDALMAMHHHIPMHRILQIGCSIVGLLGLALALARQLYRTPPAPLEIAPAVRTRTRIWMLVAIAIGAALFVARLFAIGHTTEGDFMVAPVTGALAGILVVALASYRHVRCSSPSA